MLLPLTATGLFIGETFEGSEDALTLGIEYERCINESFGVEDCDEGSEFLARVGVEYTFEVGNFEIAPQLNVDFVDGEEVCVAGLLIAKGF